MAVKRQQLHGVTPRHPDFMTFNLRYASYSQLVCAAPPQMCVCVWTIWRDVKLLNFAGGWGSLGVLHLAKTAPSGCDISARPALAYLHHSSYGKWPSQEPPSRLSFRFHRFSCTVFAICLSQQFFDFFSHTGYGDGSFLHFGKSLHQPTPVRCNGSVFARKMHSTTEFRNDSSEQVCVED